VSSEQTEELSPIKRALLEIRELRARLAQVEAARHDPIAIVGLSLRFPGGARDAESFGRLLWSGTDAVTEIPAERWSLDALYADDPDAPGKMMTRYGAFLDEVDRFDAEFFGISPREAETMDPQQRLMLEVAWEALEDAGRAGAALAGSRTGVYLGISNNDYGRALYAHPKHIDAYFSTGNAFSVLAGRLSYFLGVQGPAIAVDTACSSSLVALHLACQALRSRECDMALAGGVNLILTPEMNINFSKARMMAPDGRCKTFDAAADGYVRGEGVGLVVLRRLSDALAEGDRVLAVVRGSAINQDGRSSGLTAPNGPAQEAVIRAALADAQIAPSVVGYVEAHGTGTSLGDPIEVGALGAALCAGRSADQPLMIGSVKTNFGHLEAAAGIAGLIKVVLALQSAQIPRNLHFHKGNPHIDWSMWPVTVPTATTPWKPIDGRRVAGVSSFGFSGTNAHVVLGEAPRTAAGESAQGARGSGTNVAGASDGTIRSGSGIAGAARSLQILALSARDSAALAELARRYESRLAEPVAIENVCRTANTGRAHFAHRLAVVGSTSEEIRAGLAAFAAGKSVESLVTGRLEGSARAPRVAFLFTGQGAQHAGMGRALYDSSPIFRRVIDQCAAALSSPLDRGLLEVMFAPAGDELINEARYAQPATFALEVALAALWRSWGIEPAALMGHSLGEYAAACVAGVFSIEDGIRIVAERGRLMQERGASGAMAAVFAEEQAVQSVVARSGGALTLAAYNGPTHFVVSGPRPAVEQAVAQFESSGVRAKLLRVSLAAHSPLIEPALPAFRKAFDGVKLQPASIAMVSNVTGAVLSPDETARVDYWLAHMRQPVRFAQSMQALSGLGISHYVEVGPHPVLLGMAAECVSAPDGNWLPSLHRERPNWVDLLASVQRLYVGGATIDWAAVDGRETAPRVALPLYPFRHKRYWLDIVGKAASDASTTGDAWAEVAKNARLQASQGPLDLNADSYPAKWDCLARITTAHAVRTLREAGLFVRSGESHTLDTVMQKAGIAATYRHLVQRWLERLVAGGLLVARADTFTSARALPEPNIDALWAEADRLFADNRALLDYVRHCGSLVSAVLRGQESPLETLFPGGSPVLAENLYERSATMRYVNGIAAAVLSALARTVPGGRALRILEVGAGTGGTSAALLPVLPPDRARYTFTDVSDLFLDRARERFAAYPFVEYRRFDMEQDPAAQGYAAGSFDVIVSANAVHASTDLRLALSRLHGLLAPGGTLVLVESTVHLDWFDMTTGLIEGWQHFKDDLRVDNPLLPPETWLRALKDAGFADSMALPDGQSIASELGQHVLVARVPGLLEGGAATSRDGADSASDASQTAAPAAQAVDAARALREKVLETLPADRLELLRDFVRERVVSVLKLDSSEPPSRHDRLMDLGFDSLMAVQLRNQLARGLALEKPLGATVLFDYPTIEALAGHLLERVAPPQVRAAAPAAVSSVVVSAAPEVLGTEAVAAMSEAEIEALLLERLGRS
jgi:acyl transferase domain-containing protein/SAM-dependent methyltransferase